MYSWGISEDQLLKNVSKMLKPKLTGCQNMDWPPSPDDLEEESEPVLLLKKLLVWLRDPAVKDVENVENDPKLCAMSDLLLGFITGKRTKLQTQISTTLHGLTRCKEIIYLLYKLNLGISYPDILYLESLWAADEVKKNAVCPKEIAVGIPGTAIIDNDDFEEDTLTGGGTSHRTNMMFVQPEDIAEDAGKDNVKLKRIDKKEIKQILQPTLAAPAYKTLKRGSLPSNPEYVTKIADDTFTQRLRGVAHALVRIDEDGSCVPEDDQNIGAYSGFQASLGKPMPKNKAYYHLTHPQPPKESVVHELMHHCVAAANAKEMPFIQLVGDQPVYVLIQEIKNENPETFENILPVLGGFHIQGAFMSTIYKRFQGSGLLDLVVSADAVKDGSAKQALSGKHHNRGMRAHKLTYEALVRIIVSQRLKEGTLPDEVKATLTEIRNVEKPVDERRQLFEGILSEKMDPAGHADQDI